MAKTKKATKRKTKDEAKMELATLADLKEAEWNPRDITPDALNGLKVSLGEFGDLSGIVFNVRTATLVTGSQRVRALRESLGDEFKLEAGAIVHPQTGERIDVRVVDWTLEKQKMANLAANNAAIQGQYTTEAERLLEEMERDAPDLAEALLLDEMRIPRDRAQDEQDDGGGGNQPLLDQAVQLRPTKEYAVIVCADDLEWERLKEVLKLGLVRRGGYKRGSAMDHPGTQRVVKAADFFRFMTGRDGKQAGGA